MKSKCLYLTVLVGFFAFLWLAPVPVQAGDYTLQGTVRSDREFCIDAAVLSLTPLNDPLAAPLSAVSGASGEYSLAGLEPITYTGTVSHPGCETLPFEITLETPVQTWSPLLQAERYSIRGKVTRAIDGEPVPLLQIAYTVDGQPFTTFTSADGSYTIPALFYDQQIAVSAPVQTAYHFTPAEGYTASGLTANLTGWDFVQAGARTIAGEIFPQGWAPPTCIESVNVTFTPVPASEGPVRSVLTDASGQFSIDGMLPVYYRITITRPGCQFFGLPMTIPPTLIVHEGIGIGAQAAPYMLYGYVKTGSPATGLGDVTARFTVSPASGGTYTAEWTTNSYGVYYSPYNLGPYDQVVIRYEKAGYHFSPAEITLPGVPATTALADVTAELNTYTLAGQILRAGSGAPVSGVTVQFNELSTTTGADGRYAFTGIPHGTSGTITPTSPADSFIPAEHFIPSLEGDIDESDVTGQFLAVTNPALTGKVTYKGKPLSGVTLSFDGQTALTNAAGVYRFASVPAGTSADLVPERAGYLFTPALIHVNMPAADASGVVDVTGQDFTALRVFAIRGKVTAKDGRTALPGVTMTFGAFSAVTDARGAYTIPGIPEGTKGYLVPSLEEYRFSPAKLSLTITANAGVTTLRGIRVYPVSGQVRLPDGALEAARIALGSVSTYTAADGSYTLLVDEGVSGYLTPVKSGYHFTPVNLRVTRLSGALSGQDFDAQPNRYTLSGTLKVGTAPVANASVQVDGSDGSSALISSDRYGRYRFNNAVYGISYTFTPSALGYTFTPAQYTFPIKAANQTFAFRAAVVRRVFSGQISGLPDGISAKLVYGSGTRDFTLTGPGGAFATPALPANRTTTLKPVLAGYVFDPPSAAFGPGNETAVPASFTALPAVTITGKVSVGGKPVPNVIIRQGQYTAITSSTGSFRLDVPRSSSPVELTASHPYFHFAPQTLTPDASQTVNWTDASVLVSGQVLDSSGAGAAAVLRVSPGQSVPTQPDGSFVLEVRGVEKINLWSFILRIETPPGFTARPGYRAVSPALGSAGKNFTLSN